MHTKKELTEQIEDVRTIKSLSETYEEIAAISILQVRNSVSRTREFLAGVSGVYKTTKQVYIKKVQNLLVGKRDMANLSFVRRNGKEALVFLSANQNFYGFCTKFPRRVIYLEGLLWVKKPIPAKTIFLSPAQSWFSCFSRLR